MNKFTCKTFAILLAITFAVGGCTTMGPDGKQQTSAGNTAGAGAAAGAAIGYLLGGNGKAMLIGAALGGGAGYLVALDAQKKELAEAKTAAVEIQRDTPYLKPVVYTQNYQDVKSGEKTEGLKSIDVDLPISQMTDKRTGQLTPKGVEAITKLQAVGDKAGGLEIIVPASMKAETFKSLVQAAPHSRVSMGDSNKVVARISAKPVDVKSGVRVAV